MFEEGIRIPVVRIARQGLVDDDMLRLISSNTRDPEERVLDLKVQIATNHRGSEAVKGLLNQMGLTRALNAVEDVIRYTRNRLVHVIGELKEGSYSFVNIMDEHCISSECMRKSMKDLIRHSCGFPHELFTWFYSS